MDTENGPGLPVVDLGGEDLLEPGTALLVPAETSGYAEDIALFRTDSGAYYALDDECPHEVASLSEGWIEDDEVECPQHSSRFCLRDGKVLCLPAVRDARTHKVQVLAGRVMLHPGTVAGGH